MRSTWYFFVSSMLLLIGVVGCGVSDSGDTPARLPATSEMAAYTPAEGVARYSAAPPVTAGTGLAKTGATVSASTDRKIIYSAQVELAVEDFSPVADRVAALVKQFGAYVADSGLSGASGQNRRGTWKIRVPVAKFEEFVNATKGLGELISAGTSSMDVSEEYYDVDARIRNKTKEEERLLKLLEERPGKLEDVIAIERELSRIREELERMQGRMCVLADLTALTTVNLTINEIRGYQPAEAPTLATRVRRSFQESITAIQHTGEDLLVGCVGIVPWLPVMLVLAAPLALVVRRVRRRFLASTAGV